MRAIFSSEINQTLTIEGNRFHHLKVVRVKLNDDLLVLDGLGNYHFTKITEINKKNIVLNLIKTQKENPKPSKNIDLALALPQKSTFLETIRIATELGINKLIPFVSKYSDNYNFLDDRVDRIIQSACIQSNNPFLLEYLKTPLTLNQLPSIFSAYDQVIYFTPKKIKKPKISTGKTLIIIGPEGGLSLEEESKLNVLFVNLPCHILRTPTAVAATVGFILNS